MKKNISNGIILALLAAIVSESILSCESSPASPPNIVIIVIDSLRADHLPFYGYGRETAPFLTELASESVVFRNAYSTSSWTAPARW